MGLVKKRILLILEIYYLKWAMGNCYIKSILKYLGSCMFKQDLVRIFSYRVGGTDWILRLWLFVR